MATDEQPVSRKPDNQMAQNIKYEPLLNWQCLRCCAYGTLAYNPEELHLIIEDRILWAHQQQSPRCAEYAGAVGHLRYEKAK